MKQIQVITGLLAAVVVFSACSGSEVSPGNEVSENEVRCGDGVVSGNEACDGSVGVPATCEAFDAGKTWAESGFPACVPDCSAITAGTCVEKAEKQPVCGDGVIEGDEVCDRTSGVPTSCSGLDSSKVWEIGGKPECSSDCKSVLQGTCVSVACGDGAVTGEEWCDGDLELAESCREYDPSRKWEPGGQPGCSEDCMNWTAGTCVEIVCGDGHRSEGETCDGNDGVPETCEAYRPKFVWAEGGKPGCSDDCSAVTAGTCQMLKAHEVTYVNWNVQVDYVSWGGHPVRPRLQKLRDLVLDWKKTWTTMPLAIGIVEVSPNWHSPESTKVFNELGYYWADENIQLDVFGGFDCGENKENVSFEETGVEDAHAAGCFLFTSMLYYKEKYELLDADYAKLEPDKTSQFYSNKVAATCAVLQERETLQQFIVCSTHWEPNNGVDASDIPAGIVGPVAKNEMVRISGAHIAADLVKRLQGKYPDAHVFFGGDFNTLDMNIVFQSPVASAILGKDWDSLVQRVNLLMGSKYEHLPEDFRGSHTVFREESGLEDARTAALSDGCAENDVSTTSDPGIPSWVTDLKLPIVIDYTFYSKGLHLNKYEVLTGNDYISVSDHYPIRTVYQYQLLDR